MTIEELMELWEEAVERFVEPLAQRARVMLPIMEEMGERWCRQGEAVAAALVPLLKLREEGLDE